MVGMVGSWKKGRRYGRFGPWSFWLRVVRVPRSFRSRVVLVPGGG